MQALVKGMRRRHWITEEPSLSPASNKEVVEAKVVEEADEVVEKSSDLLIFSLPEQPSEKAQSPSDDVAEAFDADTEPAKPAPPTHSAKRRNILAMAQAQAARRVKIDETTVRSKEHKKAVALSRKPLPEQVIPEAPAEVVEKQKQKEEEEKQIKATVFQRLQKLWGKF